MFGSIGMDNFQSEVLEQNRPVILAYIRRDYQYKEQTDVLNNLSKMFGDAVKICLIEGESAAILRRLKIGGAPAFLIFYRGKETARILGRTNAETLAAPLALIGKQNEDAHRGK